MQCPCVECRACYYSIPPNYYTLLVERPNGSAVNSYSSCLICRHCKAHHGFCGEGENEGRVVLISILTLADKVGQTRQNLQHLVEEIVLELTELQKLCQDGQGCINHIDPDSTRSLQKLHSSVCSPIFL